MSGCDSCGKNCGGCGGCGIQLELTSSELHLLQILKQIPFLPVARRTDDQTPVCLEDLPLSPEELGPVLQCLEKKGLISLDYDRPLVHFDYSAYATWPVQGSLALTARGQTAVDLLEIQGAAE